MELFSVPLAAQQKTLQDLEASVLIATSDSLKPEVIKKGQDLTYMAKTYYGNIYGWPLVWFFNREAIPNPENVPIGTKLRIPRVNPSASSEEIRAGIEAAYILVYRAYQNTVSFSDAQRRWALTQAAETGLNLKSELWISFLSESDKIWLVSKKILTAETLTVPKVVLVAPKLTNDLLNTPKKNYEKLIEAKIEAFEKSAMLDDVIGDLEVQASRPNAKPEVHFILAIAYGRKGLIGKEYLALEAAEAAARKPGVSFNITLIYGRKQLLKDNTNADTFLVGSLIISSNPSGAKVFVDGVEKGTTPLKLSDQPAGQHQFKLTYDDYEDLEQSFDLPVAGRLIYASAMKSPLSEVTIRNILPTSEVYVDGKSVGNTMPIRLQKGVYSFAVKDVNFIETKPEEINVPANKKVILDLKLVPKSTVWTIESNVSGARVYLDDEEIGVTPKLSIVIKAGQHSLRVTKEGYSDASFDQVFYVGRDGEKPLIHIDLATIKGTETIEITKSEIVENPENEKTNKIEENPNQGFSYLGVRNLLGISLYRGDLDNRIVDWTSLDIYLTFLGWGARVGVGYAFPQKATYQYQGTSTFDDTYGFMVTFGLGANLAFSKQTQLSITVDGIMSAVKSENQLSDGNSGWSFDYPFPNLNHGGLNLTLNTLLVDNLVGIIGLGWGFGGHILGTTGITITTGLGLKL